MPSLVYMGPYNDPMGTDQKHHWDAGHAADCSNPSLGVCITVDRTSHVRTLHIDLTVRNAGTEDSVGNIIKVFGFQRTLKFNNSGEVDVFVKNKMIAPPPSIPPRIIAGPWTSQTIARRVGLGDNPWRPPAPITWTPTLSSDPTLAYIFVIAATVADVDSFSPVDATQNPQVAVWVGP
jgi:hypothetical protein